MSRRISETEATILRAHIFKATVESALKGLGAHHVDFEGLDRHKAKAASINLYGQYITITAKWLESEQYRQCTYRVDWHQFDSYMLGSDLAGAKHWAVDIARQVAYERLNDVLKRATMSIPLSVF